MNVFPVYPGRSKPKSSLLVQGATDIHGLDVGVFHVVCKMKAAVFPCILWLPDTDH